MSGELKVFAGPIEDNEGKVRVPAGTDLSFRGCSHENELACCRSKGRRKIIAPRGPAHGAIRARRLAVVDLQALR